MYREVWQGRAWFGQAGQGKARQGKVIYNEHGNKHYTFYSCTARRGKAGQGEARHDMARQGKARLIIKTRRKI